MDTNRNSELCEDQSSPTEQSPIRMQSIRGQSPVRMQSIRGQSPVRERTYVFGNESGGAHVHTDFICPKCLVGFDSRKKFNTHISLKRSCVALDPFEESCRLSIGKILSRYDKAVRDIEDGSISIDIKRKELKRIFNLAKKVLRTLQDVSVPSIGDDVRKTLIKIMTNIFHGKFDDMKSDDIDLNMAYMRWLV